MVKIIFSIMNANVKAVYRDITNIEKLKMEN